MFMVPEYVSGVVVPDPTGVPRLSGDRLIGKILICRICALAQDIDRFEVLIFGIVLLAGSPQWWGDPRR
jgi:hypothetical protein